MSRRGPIETPEYADMLTRMIRGYGRRVGDGDEVDLGRMLEVRAELDAAIAQAARSLAERNGWAYVGAGLKTSRENAWKRFGKRRSA